VTAAMLPTIQDDHGRPLPRVHLITSCSQHLQKVVQHLFFQFLLRNFLVSLGKYLFYIPRVFN